MTQAAERLEFERAARLRDRIAALSTDPGRAGHQSAQRRGGRRLRGRRGSGPVLRRSVLFPHLSELGQPRLFSARRPILSPAEVLGAFLAQFYAEQPPAPRSCCSSHDIEDRDAARRRALGARRSKVEIARPQRGEKRELVEHAAVNARADAVPKACRSGEPGEIAGRARRGVRDWTPIRARRGLRQFPYHGDAMRSAR